MVGDRGQALAGDGRYTGPANVRACPIYQRIGFEEEGVRLSIGTWCSACHLATAHRGGHHPSPGGGLRGECHDLLTVIDDQ